MKRRQFLKRAGMLSVASGLSFNSNLALSLKPKDDHFFILIRVNGGMDVTLGLDAKVHKGLGGTDQKDIFLEYGEGDIFSHNNLLLGPAAGSLSKYKDEILTVNGVVMRRDAGHDVLINYMSSGAGDNIKELLPILIAAKYQSGPFGVISNESILTGLEVINTFNPINLTTANSTSNNNAISAMQRIHSGNSIFNKTARGFVTTSGIQKTIQEKIIKLNIEDEKKSIFRAVAEVFSAGEKGSRPAYQASLDLSALLGQLNLDTHSNHEGQHLEGQTRVWDSVTELFDLFKEIPLNDSSLFDHTTFMVVSEFSRTPFLNGAKGKDHNPMTNSILLAGKNIIGGKAVGDSHVIPRGKRATKEALHIGSSIDYRTGLLDDNSKSPSVDLIFPENVVKTVASCFKATDQKSLLESFDCNIIPGIVKK